MFSLNNKFFINKTNMKWVVCTNSNSKSLTVGKIYKAIKSSYPSLEEYYVVDDTLIQHWYPVRCFRDASHEEIDNLKK
jgi:hypothetical protein